jgi:biotin synthase-like enzyme
LQAARLKACGVDRINHNLNTSRRFYARICSTHSYQDRLDTLLAVREAGLEICSGGIVGMGEDDTDVVELALQLPYDFKQAGTVRKRILADTVRDLLPPAIFARR